MKTVNLVLLLIVILLVFNLMFPNTNHLTGGLSYFFDNSEPLCYFENARDQRQIPVDLCCYEIQSQINCVKSNGFNVLDSKGQVSGFDWKCYISEGSERFYLVNNKMLSYCLKEGYDVKTN
ncbi:MAG: hypothetical protein ABIG93_03065 [archaeon]|nr:hypothetical protein [Nanoarchaeota archaeon]